MGVTNPSVVEKLVSDGEAKLVDMAHPSPYTLPTMPGGTKYQRHPNNNLACTCAAGLRAAPRAAGPSAVVVIRKGDDVSRQGRRTPLWATPGGGCVLKLQTSA